MEALLTPVQDTLTPHAQLDIRFPDADTDLDQDQEWCEVKLDGQWTRFRFHDYDRIYGVPGLYEAIFYHRLQCCSPERVVGLLDDVLADNHQLTEDLTVLDVGAGNGMVGDALRSIGVPHAVGVDLIGEAREAALRDRPGLYDDYLVTDLCHLSERDESRILEVSPNCLTTVAALGFGDIPPAAFAAAYNLIVEPGWVAFNIKESFLDRSDPTGFSGMIRQMTDDGLMNIHAYRRYPHRLSVAGDPLFYVAMVGTKQGDIPVEMVDAYQP